MTLEKVDATSVAKRITRKICLVTKQSWHELLQYEEDVCRAENSWSYRSWVNFLLRLGMNEEQIFDLAIHRLNELKSKKAAILNCALLEA